MILLGNCFNLRLEIYHLLKDDSFQNGGWVIEFINGEWREFTEIDEMISRQFAAKARSLGQFQNGSFHDFLASGAIEFLGTMVDT